MSFSFGNDLSPVTLLIMMIEHVRRVYAPFAFPSTFSLHCTKELIIHNTKFSNRL